MERALPGVGFPIRVFPTTNAERMYALDKAWNARDWDTFDCSGQIHAPRADSGERRGLRLQPRRTGYGGP